MKIIIDTREQLPLQFKHEYITETVHKKLDVGDYACELNDGHVLPFVFERKSLGDLYGSLGKNHARFKKEILRAITSNTKIYLIVEKSWTMVSKGYSHSKLPAIVLLKILGTILYKYNKHFEVIFCNNREEMAQIILWRFLSAGKVYMESQQ